MVQQLPAIILVTPLVTSIIIFFTGWRYKRLAYPLTLIAMSVCLLSSVFILTGVINNGQLQYLLGGWPPPWGIEYRVDHLNAIMLILVSLLGLLTATHAKKSIEQELPERTTLFWSLFILLITGLLGICITGDLFNLFVLLEVASLSGYALIAMGEKKALYASFRYIIIGTIGASFYLLGVGHLYIATGSLNMADLAQLLPELLHSKTILVGFAFILLGLCIKMAIFPMHVWLPDAYTYAPSAVSAAVAPLMTKVMAYVMIRVMFTVFQPEFSIMLLRVTDIMVWSGTFAILFGAVMALSQNDFKRMLSYIIVAEIGYIIGGIGVANAIALKGAIFHIVNDAMMMTCLFFVAGHIMHQTGGHRIDDFKGMFKTMPVTAAIFTVGALAIIGVPPTCGFFSKWYLLLGGIKAQQWGFVAALLICTLINVALFFRVFDKGLFIHTHGNGPAHTDFTGKPLAGEAPLTMLIPAFSLALVIILAGVFNQFIVNDVISFAIPLGF
ncbi:proton-conducting transporter membrane subunit [Desulfococcaceae bacterium HSG9]|nr:proton-conducting transporter membrane subunit [Desulfococcaceae bacterium HSG9]